MKNDEFWNDERSPKFEGHPVIARRVFTVFQFRVVAPMDNFFSIAVLESLVFP